MPSSGGSGFRPTLLSSLVAGAALVVLLGLGFWQVERLSWKTELIAELRARAAEPALELPPVFPPEDLQYRRVRLDGTFLPGKLLQGDDELKNLLYTWAPADTGHLTVCRRRVRHNTQPQEGRVVHTGDNDPIQKTRRPDRLSSRVARWLSSNGIRSAASLVRSSFPCSTNGPPPARTSGA